MRRTENIMQDIILLLFEGDSVRLAPILPLEGISMTSHLLNYFNHEIIL